MPGKLVREFCGLFFLRHLHMASGMPGYHSQSSVDMVQKICAPVFLSAT